MKRYTALLFGIFILLLVGLMLSQRTKPSTATWIFFETTLGFDREIMRTNGITVQNVTKSSNFECCIRFENGWLYFTSDRGGVNQLWRMRSDTSDVQVSNAGFDRFANESPNGEWILTDDGQNIIRQHTSGRYRILTDTPDWDCCGAWSPDGEWIAFVSNRNMTGDIYLMDFFGDQIRPMVTWPSEEASPVWSPDGEWIYFESDYGNNRGIYRVHVREGDIETVANTIGIDCCPEISEPLNLKWNPLWIGFAGLITLSQVREYRLEHLSGRA